MNRRRILVLTPRYPYPVVGGDRLRIYALCRELARHHELTLLSLCETEEELHSPCPVDGVFANIERVLLPRWRSLLGVLTALPGRTPLQIAYYRSPEFAERVQALLPKHDLCVAHLIRTGEYVRSSPVPVVLEMTDAISMNYQRVRELGKSRGFRSWVYRLEADRLLEYERAVLDDFAIVTLVAEPDRDYLLQARGAPHVMVCSNGVDVDALPFSERRDSEPVAVFIGNMTSIQNLDAALFFAEEVLPLIREGLPCRLRVIGRIRPRDAKRLEALPGVEVLANVRSVANAVGRARVGVAPVRLGAGVQNKVLEYMALGLPVVTSRIALEGLQARPDQEVLVADTPAEYAAALQRLWEHEDLRSTIATAARAYVREHHAWSNRLGPLLDAINRLPVANGGR